MINIMLKILNHYNISFGLLKQEDGDYRELWTFSFVLCN